MLLLGSQVQTIEGITVFPDHADPSQFWYLPGPVTLLERAEDQRKLFSFIKYKPAAVSAGVKGGGFLAFTAGLKLTPQIESRIMGRLPVPAGGGEPRLTAVPFDEGTVECVALNLQGEGGTVAKTADDGTFNAVEQILGAHVPSLAGDNAAVFSLQLSQEGATILEQALEQGATPIGVIYKLKYTALRPALDIEITADFKRIYDGFSASLSGQVYIFKAGIDAAFEKLVQDGAIKIKVIQFTTDADRGDKEKWALDFFKDKLLNDWFTPTLTPGQVEPGIRSGGPAGPLGTPTTPTTPTTRPLGTGTATTSGGGGFGTTTATRPATTPTTPTTPRAPTTPTTPTAPRPGGFGTGTAPPAPPRPPAPPTGGGLAPTPGALPGETPAAPPTGTPPATPTPPTTPTTGTPPTTPTTPTTPTSRPATPTTTPTTPTPPTSRPPTPTTTPTTGTGGAVAAAQQAAQQAAGGAAASSAVVQLNLKFVRQEELKTLSFKYSSQEAVQRTYAPQSLLGLLTADMNKADYFVEVDLDDPFFREFDVDVRGPANPAGIGLSTATVGLDYGSRDDPATLKHADLVFDGNGTPSQQFKVFMNAEHDLAYTYTPEYQFDPDSGWDGERLSYTFGPIETEDRTLNLEPRERMGFLKVDVFPHRMDDALLDYTDVELSYDDPNGWQARRTLTVTPDAPAQTWKVRTSDPEALRWSYRLVHHLKDGTARADAPVETLAAQLPVPDPFDSAIEPEFIPQFPAGSVQQLLVDVQYDDPDNNYHRSEKLDQRGSAIGPASVRIAILNPDLRSYRYRATLVGTDGKIVRGDWIDTAEEIVGIDATGREA